MRAPELPFFFALAVLPGLGLAALGWMGLRWKSRFLHASLISWASGISLLVVAGVSMGAYALNIVERLGPPPLLLSIPALAFAIGLFPVLQGRPFNGGVLAFAAATALVLVYGLSIYVALLSACSFGDCL